MRILYLDIDGGQGGTGRSLYYLIKNLDRKRYVPRVILDKGGPNVERYRSMDVPVEIRPLPRTNVSLRYNSYFFLKMFLRIAPTLWLIRRVRALKRGEGVDCIHCNHESLFFLAWLLKRLLGIPIVFHIRTTIPQNVWAGWEYGIVRSVADHLIFISENERDNFCAIVGRRELPPNTVVYNSAEKREFGSALPDGMAAVSNKFRVVSLSNFGRNRGVDRLAEVAAVLKRLGEGRIVFVVCGRVTEPGLDLVMMKAIRSMAVEDYFLFLGSQPDPEGILAHCDVLIKLTRVKKPWGRDVIEALTYGKPPISIGSFSRFVENDVTGVLFADYDADAVADALRRFVDDQDYRERLGRNGEARAGQLFNGSNQARKVERIYEGVVRSF